MIIKKSQWHPDRRISRYSVCCPFHEEAVPSCCIDPNKGTFHCWGCGVQGYLGENDTLFTDELENMEGEKEIFSCHTGLAVSDEFFCGKQSMGDEDLLPAVHQLMHQLMHQCEGMIRTSGIYSFKLRVVKVK